MGSQVRVLYRAPHVKVPESLRFRDFRYFDELGVWKNLPNHLKSYENCRSLTAKKQAAPYADGGPPVFAYPDA